MENEIYLEDLKPEIQEKGLEELGIKCAREGNYDVFPLFAVCKPK